MIRQMSPLFQTQKHTRYVTALFFFNDLYYLKDLFIHFKLLFSLGVNGYAGNGIQKHGKIRYEFVMPVRIIESCYQT